MRDSSSIVLVGNNSLLREGVGRILRSAKFSIVTSVSCADFLSSEVQPHQPLFLVLHTGDDFDVVAEQIELLRRNNPGGRIAIVADRYQAEELASAFRTGADGYFVDVTPDAFIKSIKLLMMGETVLPAAFLRFVLGPEGAPPDHADSRAANNDVPRPMPEDAFAAQLSPREKSILRCLVDGDSNKSIARKFQITEGTVKGHVKAILRKIRVRNRTQAAIWGTRNGWPARTTAPIRRRAQ